MAITLATVVFLRFGPSYYFRPLLPLDGLTGLVHVHGFVFTAWMALFVAQSALVLKHRTATHRKLGVAAAILAVGMVIVGIGIDRSSITPEAQAAWEARNPSLLDSGARVAARNSGNVVLFGMLFAGAFALRHNSAAHKRLMLLATVAIMMAPTVRLLSTIGWPLTLGSSGFTAPNGFFVQTVTPFLATANLWNLVCLPYFLGLVGYDLKTLNSVHPATLVGGLLIFSLPPIGSLIPRMG